MSEYNKEEYESSQRPNRLGERIERIIKSQIQALEVVRSLEVRIGPVLSPEESEKSVPMDKNSVTNLHSAPASELASAFEEINQKQELILQRLSALIERIDL